MKNLKLLFASLLIASTCFAGSGEYEKSTSVGPGSGDVVGPASSTDECFSRFDQATGKLLQNSVVCSTDAGVVTGVTDLDVNGRVALGSTATFGVVSTSNKLWNLSETITDFSSAQSWDMFDLAAVMNPSVDLTTLAGNAKYLTLNSGSFSVPNANSSDFEFLQAINYSVLHNGTGDVLYLSGGVFGATVNNTGDATQVVGLQGSVSNQGTSTNVGIAVGGFFSSGAFSASAVTALDRSVWIGTPDHVGTLTAHQGLFLSDQSFGVTPHSILSEGGNVEFSSVTGKTSNFVLSSADVANPFTALTTANSFGVQAPISGTAGGMRISAFSDTDAQPLQIIGAFGATDPTDATAAIRFSGAKFDGVNNLADLGAAETVIHINNNGTNLFKILGDGSTTVTGTLTSTGLGTVAGLSTSSSVDFSAGVAPSTSNYQILRDNTATNIMKINAPAGAQVQATINGNARFQVSNSQVATTQAATAGGTANTAFTINAGTLSAQTASTEISDFILSNARTVTWGTGALATNRVVRFDQPTHATVGGSTFTQDINVDIAGAPTSGSNVTMLQPIGMRMGVSGGTYIANAASIYRDLFFATKTVTYTGATNITSASPSSQVFVGQTTYTNASSATMAGAAGLYIVDAPAVSGSLTKAADTGFNSIWVDAGTSRFDGRVLRNQGADIASANDLTLGIDGNTFEITGTTQVNAITTAGWQNGSQITLLFTSTPTVKHNTAGGGGTSPILLSGAADFAATAGDTLTLVLSEIGGTVAWREVARTAI